MADPGVKELMDAGYADALDTLGCPVNIFRGNAVLAGAKAIITETSGEYQAEYGGALYTVSAVAQIARSLGLALKGGDRLQEVMRNRKYMVLAATTSSYDNCVRLIMTTI